MNYRAPHAPPHSTYHLPDRDRPIDRPGSARGRVAIAEIRSAAPRHRRTVFYRLFYSIRGEENPREIEFYFLFFPKFTRANFAEDQERRRRVGRRELPRKPNATGRDRCFRQNRIPAGCCTADERPRFRWKHVTTFRGKNYFPCTSRARRFFAETSFFFFIIPKFV